MAIAWSTSFYLIYLCLRISVLFLMNRIELAFKKIFLRDACLLDKPFTHLHSVWLHIELAVHLPSPPCCALFHLILLLIFLSSFRLNLYHFILFLWLAFFFKLSLSAPLHFGMLTFRVIICSGVWLSVCFLRVVIVMVHFCHLAQTRVTSVKKLPPTNMGMLMGLSSLPPFILPSFLPFSFSPLL